MAYTTIDKGSSYFNTVLYTGTGSSLANTGVGFKPDLVWIKGRSGATDHGLYDAVRGVQKDLVSNATSAETTQTTGLTAFGSDGFTVGALAKLNTSAATYVAWNWLGANTTVSNTSGSITSTVSANTTSGFSIVSYTSNALSSGTIGHGLGVAPSMIIVKLRGSTSSWAVYHKSLGATKYMFLNATDASATNVAYWNNTEPTSTLFSVGNSTSTNNNPATTEIAYCFAEVKGYSKFGSYIGNGSADGLFVYTGFKPAFVMVKRTTVGGIWWLTDNKRSPSNVVSLATYVQGTTGDDAGTFWDMNSNGFKIRDSGTQTNESGTTFIYMAFAENPFVSSKGIPCTAR
jgi:hypothetical protein